MDTPHATNALNKARTALLVLEEVIVPRVFDDLNHHDALTRCCEAMFTGNGVYNRSLWTALGAAHALHDRRPAIVTYDTSRPFIEAELRRRMRETDTDQNDTVDNPFDVFASDQSGWT